MRKVIKKFLKVLNGKNNDNYWYKLTEENIKPAIWYWSGFYNYSHDKEALHLVKNFYKDFYIYPYDDEVLHLVKKLETIEKFYKFNANKQK